MSQPGLVGITTARMNFAVNEPRLILEEVDKYEYVLLDSVPEMANIDEYVILDGIMSRVDTNFLIQQLGKCWRFERRLKEVK